MEQQLEQQSEQQPELESSVQLEESEYNLCKDLIFTRYLYASTDVLQALATNLLLKNATKSRFWAMELLHSGLINDLIGLFWNAYFNYYFTLNPEFYHYLIKQTKRLRIAYETKDTPNIPECENTVRDICANLMIRPFNTDVLRACMCSRGDQEVFLTLDAEHCEETSNALRTVNLTAALDAIQNKNVVSIGHAGFTNAFDLLTDFENLINSTEIAPTNRKKICSIFVSYKKAHSSIDVAQEVVRVAFIVIVATYSHKLKMGKKLFTPISNTDDNEAIEMEKYRTKTPADLGVRADKSLTHLLTISMSDELSYSLPNDDDSIGIPAVYQETADAYRQHWEYYAWRAPLWRERILRFGGTIDDETCRVIFNDDDKLEAFYQEYGHDPEEQDSAVARRNLAFGMNRKTADEYCLLIEQSGNTGNNHLFDK